MKLALHSYKQTIREWDPKWFRQGLIVLADQCGYSVIALLLSILLARTCSKETYGTFVLGMTFVFFAKVIQRSLVSVPFSVQYSKVPAESRDGYFANSVVQHWMVTGLLAVLVACTGGGLEMVHRSGEYAVLTFCFVLLTAVSLSADFVRTILITQFRYVLCLIVGIVIQAAIAGSLLFFYFSDELTLYSACWILCGGYGGYTLISSLFIRLPFRIHADTFRADLRTNGSQGHWILSSTLVNYAGLQVIPWITLFWWDQTVVAVVAVLSVVPCILRPLLQALIHFLTPRFSELLETGGLARVRSRTLFMIYLLAVLGFVLVAGFAFFGDWFICRIYGQIYGGYGCALILFTVSACLRAMNAPLRAMITAIGQPRCLVTSSVWATAASLLSALYLIPAFAVTGIALVHVLYNAVTFTVNSVQAFRETSCPCLRGQTVPM